MKTTALLARVALTGGSAACALALSMGTASAAATIQGPNTGAELTPPPRSSSQVCGKVTVEPGNYAVQGAVVTATITGTSTTGSATTNASGGYCINGSGFANKILTGGTVTLSVDPSSVSHNGVVKNATYPNGGEPLDEAWFAAHASGGLNATGANIAYQ